MGKIRRCSGCKMLLSEHTFGKSGKSCTGPEQSADVSVVNKDQESIKTTLASFLGAVKSLTTGLKEVQANKQQLHALLTNRSPIKRFPFQLQVLAVRHLWELLCRSCGQCKICHNKPIDASLNLSWWIPAIVTWTMTMLRHPQASARIRAHPR